MIRAALLFLLLVASPHPVVAQAPDLMPVWRQLFARPAGPPPAPADNPVTEAKVALGRELFFDTRLSGAGDRSCATCHQPDRAFTDGRTRGKAIGGGDLARNTPAIHDGAWAKSFYWDGRASTLEAQAEIPITHPREMAGAWSEIVRRLKADSALDVRFHQAFTERPAIQPATILKALAAFERTIVSPPTRFDRWIAGDERALTVEEIAGFRLFTGRAGCVGCHSGWRFTDDRFHDIGLASDDPGRGAIPGGVPGLKAFKTPSLREASWTAPYMHDGSKPTFDAVLDHYAGGFVTRPGLSTNLVRGLTLDGAERGRLLQFLATLSSPAPASDPRAGPTR